ncbi:MAG: TolC family protein, partial [Planctomycetes bacterium]|nr:TolC family protein [Planctomycetota bacterium]
LSLARKLLSGGQFSLSTSASQSGTVGGPGTDSNSSSVSASFSAPLLAGAGIAARETMVQARRSLLQSARSFESFRQEMVIGIITQYYGLLRQKRAIETAKQRVRQAEFLYGQSNALFKKGRKSFAEVLVAEQSKLNSDNDLVNIVEEYDLALDRFKQDLGLRADLHMDIAEEEIEPEIIIVDLAMATKTAFENRLDYITQREHIEDAERAVEIARNALLPQLSLALQAGVSSDADGMLTDYRLDDGSSSLGLTLELPLDRKSQRNSYKSTLISLARARRSFSLFEDNMRLSVRDTVRKLQRAEVTLAIQKKQVKTAMDRLEVEKIYQEKGQRSSQDIVNAQNALQNARNALVEAQINYLIATIRLRKDIGTLRVNERGEWH